MLEHLTKHEYILCLVFIIRVLLRVIILIMFLNVYSIKFWFKVDFSYFLGSTTLSGIMIVFATLVALFSNCLKPHLSHHGLSLSQSPVFCLAGVTSWQFCLNFLFTACTSALLLGCGTLSMYLDNSTDWRLPSTLWAYSRHWVSVESFCTCLRSSCFTSECLLCIRNKNLTISSEFINSHCLAKSLSLYMNSDWEVISSLLLKVVPILYHACIILCWGLKYVSNLSNTSDNLFLSVPV